MTDPDKQYSLGLRRQLHEMDSVSVYRQPGRKAPANANACLLGGVVLSQFDQLPRSTEFKERFGTTPHAILFLGARTVLAMVEDESMPVGATSRAWQHLVAYNRTTMRTVMMISPGNDKPVELGRQQLARSTGLTDMSVSSQHGLLIPSGRAWTYVDSGSLNGSYVVLEAGSGDTNGLPVDSGATDIFIDDTVPDFDTMGPPAAISEPFPLRISQL